MNIVILISSLLGAAASLPHIAALEESLEARVSVKPPGSTVYLGECVLLQCVVESNCTFVRSYRWSRSKPLAAAHPRHLVSGDTYSITAVTREDADRYWCQAECWMNKTVFVVNALPVALNVSELLPPSLTLTPDSTQMLRGEQFRVQCPALVTNSSGWKLMHFSPDRTAGARVTNVPLSPPGGGVDANKFVATNKSRGLYWCKNAGGRSNAVSITVSSGNIVLKTPASPVSTGDEVVLYCQYRTGSRGSTVFFRNGAQIETSNSSSPDDVIRMTIKNVTQEDEGLYKCASLDRRMESPESWLSVRPGRDNLTSTEATPASSSGSWKWIVLSSMGVPLFLIPLLVWLVCHYRYQKVYSCSSCWPLYKQDIPAQVLPATKQDVTEVQWDLSWMEMSNLLDK